MLLTLYLFCVKGVGSVSLMNFMKNKLHVGQSYLSVQNDWLCDTLRSIPDGLSILDAGAGELRNKKYCEHLHYVSQDKCEYTGGSQGELMQTGSWDTHDVDIISDITEIPVDDASFDVVLCTEVLEHVPDPLKTLNELVRILKPGGKLIITAPFCSLTHFAPFHFSTGFNRYYYKHHLNLLGLEILDMTTNGNYFEYIAQELWRLNFMSKNYSRRMNIFQKLIIYIALNILQKMSNLDKGSDRILCFGYHVVAFKK